MNESENNPNFLQFKMDFSNFLEPDSSDSIYGEKVERMVEEKKRRLVVNLGDLNQFDPNMRENILHSPMDHLPAWEESLKDYIGHGEFGKIDTSGKYSIGFEGTFGENRITPQELMSSHVGQMVCIEGIVTKVSLVRPKVMQTVHYCEKTKKYHTQNYKDATALNGLPTGASYPTTDSDGNPLVTEFGLSKYMDHQRVYIQDMPERTSAGSMPQTIECILDDDLVDQCKPGDRVQMIGIYRALAGKVIGSTNGRFRTVVLVNHINKLGVNDSSRILSVNEIRNIKKLSKRKDIFGLLSKSIAPSLYGHKYIKKAILLQLLGGIEKNLENGTHIRGDINILMVGDPSCGKSQLLRAVMNSAPLVINTTGRGSSGVGLTAAVTHDKESGERRLEAGAMVLADRGIVCIDEFDKMSDIDRTAIHEVMEQQSVTISKAGIHTSLNARCSVIAAANPVYGMYDRTLPPHLNIGLPDSLLSRFDLLFIVLDKIDTKIDRNISDHVLSMHLVPHKDEMEHESLFDDLNENNETTNDVPIWDNSNNKNKSKKRNSKNKNKNKLLNTAFVKKYIEFAKKQKKPILTEEACELIAQNYAELRSNEDTQTLPITARCLETIIRLSTAVAKLRLSKEIDDNHVEEAMEVLNYALTNDAKPQNKQKNNKKRKNNSNSKREIDSSSDEEEDEEEEDDQSEGGNDDSPMNDKSKNKNKNINLNESKEMEKDLEMKELQQTNDSEINDLLNIDTPISRRSKRLRNTLDQSLVMAVTKHIGQMFKKTRAEQIKISDLLINLNKSNNISINETELNKIVDHLHDISKIFKADDAIVKL